MIKFANGESYETIRILGGSETYQGQQRRTLAISIDASIITLEGAKALYMSETALSEITIESAGEINVQLNFTLPVELTLTKIQTGEETMTEVITIKLAQKSTMEIAQERQAEDINDTQMALIELADMLATTGGEA